LIWIVIIACWGFLGVGVVIYLAAMGSVDTSLIDAARIDGASWLRVQRHIVFPEILPVIELMTVLSIIGSFTNFFGLILLITHGGPSYSTTTADLYAYKLAFEQFEPGYASAVTVVLLIVSVTAGGAAFAFFRRKRT
jgi:multiple sugar transport system permease protein